MHKILAAAATASLLVSGSALAQPTEQPVNVMSYALSHPLDNAGLNGMPQIGNSVPQTVQLQRIEGSRNFGYFYYRGAPIIVDMRTRAIVRIGE